MSDEFNDLGGDFTEEPAPPPPPRSNRTLWVIGGILGAGFLMALIGIILYQLVILPRLQAQQQAATQAALAEATANALVMTQVAGGGVTSIPKAPTVTATPLPPTATRTPTQRPTMTNTPLIAAGTTATGSLVQGNTVQQTGTAAAAAAATKATQQKTATALPSTGLADEFGAPGLFGLAIAFLAVIGLTRRLRTSHHSFM